MIVALGVAKTALAETSIYTRLNLSACERQGVTFLEVWRCPGVDDVALWVTRTMTGFMLGVGAQRGLAEFASRDEAWPLEWRGTGQGATLRVSALILRVVVPDQAGSVLLVFRLRPDRSACLLASVASSEGQSETAHRIADDPEQVCPTGPTP